MGMDAQLLSNSAGVESDRASQNGLGATNDRRVDHLPIQHENAFT
jgi:hypothetical protein